jgi:hypothetical protein
MKPLTHDADLLGLTTAIAVIGTAGRFAGAPNREAFQRNPCIVNGPERAYHDLLPCTLFRPEFCPAATRASALTRVRTSGIGGPLGMTHAFR